MSTVVAAIDVGSNAIRLAIGSRDRFNNLVLVESYREAIRLGQDVFTSGVISDETTERVAAAFVQFRQLIERHAVRKTRAVGTSALREAVNQDSLIETVHARSGIKIEVIQGNEEARLVAEAVAAKIDLARKLALLIDIGGGSIEISLIEDGDIILSDSVKMGAVRLLQILKEKDRSAKIFQRLVKDYAQSLRRQLKRELGSRKVALCIGTGGNLESFADLKRGLLKREDSSFLTAKELDDISDQLQVLSFRERVERLDLKEDRADVIIPAVIVLQAVLREADADKILIPRVSLKDGVMLELLQDAKFRSAEAHRKQVLAFTREIASRFDVEPTHAEKVSSLALSLFDDLKNLHQLNGEHRLLLEIAARLHDIGHAVNINDHHKHGAYILRSTPFVGITEREKSIVAALVRYHRKGVPKGDHPETAALSKGDRENIARLASILRMAEAMDKGHTGAVRSVGVQSKGNEVSFALRGEGELLLERWALEQNKQLFEKAFNVKATVLE